MKKTISIVLVMSTAVLFLILSGCSKTPKKAEIMTQSPTFADEVRFLGQYTETIVLSDEKGQAQLVITPAWQSRVMTSTAGGNNGLSFGWINHAYLEKKEIQEHINVYGGEDRVWFGPEGGQFSIFFKNGDPFDLDHWYVPAAIDHEAFDTLEKNTSSATFQKSLHLKNYSNTEFDAELLRKIQLLPQDKIVSLLDMDIPQSVKSVGYMSVNTLKNTGDRPWTKKTGCLSVWVLGMFNPSPQTTIVIPFVKGDETDLGPIVNDAYFGKVPPDRIKTGDGYVFFKGDGLYRCKIGLSPRRSQSILGSYDAGNHTLTLVTYTKPEGVLDYINSMWEIQDQPYAGDTVNSYNDGPPEPGAKPLGPFYELETSSPAAALKPGESLTHEHRTFHFEGTEADLDLIARHCLGVSLAEIKDALK